MNKEHPEFDEDTGLPHQAPQGLEHQGRRLNGKGAWYSVVKMPHYLICLHQEAFPDPTEKMRTNANPSNIYSAFLAMLPLEVSGKLTPELKKQILRTFGILK